MNRGLYVMILPVVAIELTLVEEPGKNRGRTTAAGDWEKLTDIFAYQ